MKSRLVKKKIKKKFCFGVANSIFVSPFKMNGVLGLKPSKCHISRSRHRRDIYFTPIDAEYTILYTHLRGCIALSGLEKKLFK